MNNFRFRRFLSGVLALVMMTSALTVVNVVSVSAADSVWSYGESGSAPSWLNVGTSSNVTFSKGTEEKTGFGSAHKIFKEGTSDCLFNETAYKYGSGNSFDVTIGESTGTKDNATLTIFAAREEATDGTVEATAPDSCTVNSKNKDSQAVPSARKATNEETKTINPLSFELAGAGKYTFKFGSSANGVFRFVLTTSDDPEDSTPYTWTVKTDKVSALTEPETNLTVSNQETVGTRNILLYKGTDYTLMPIHSNLYPDMMVGSDKIVSVEDKQITVTPTMDMFMKNVNIPKNNISITGGANRVLHLTCKTHGTTYSILLDEGNNDDDIAHAKALLVSDGNGYYKLSDSGTIDLPIHDDVYTASMAGGNLTINGAPSGEITLSAEANSITGSFGAIHSTAVQEDTGKVDVFSGLKTTGEGIAERLYTGTVLGPEGKKYFRVVGPTGPSEQENYGNIYAISGTAESEAPGSDAFAVVIRSNSDDTVDGGGIGFDISSNVKPGSKFDLDVYCTAVSDRVTGGDQTTIGLTELNVNPDTREESFGSPVGSPQKVTMVEESNKTAPEQPITFENLEPGKSYAIYNPGLDTENGNIRVYAMALRIKDGVATGDSFVDVLDPAQIDSSKMPSSTDSSSNSPQVYTTGGGDKGTAGNKFTIAGKASIASTDSKQKLNLLNGESIETDKYILFAGSSDKTKKNITFETEDGSATGKLCVFATINKDSGNKNLFLNNGSADESQNVSSGRNGVPVRIDFDISAGKAYTIYAADQYRIFYVGSTIPLKALGEPEVKAPVITGTVTLKDEYKYIEPSNVTDKDGSKITPNVIEPGSDSNKIALNKTVDKQIGELKVEAQDAEGNKVAEDKINITDNKTFTIGGEEGLTPNTKYTVTVTADGVTSKQEVDLKETAETANFDLTTPSVTVRFVTNIKNYKDSNDTRDQNIPQIQTSDGTALFDLADVTYYTQGADLNSLEAVNGSASTTHIVSMPKGKYKYAYDSDYYTLSQDSSGASDSMEFEVTASGRKYIYFTPKIAQLKQDVTDTVSTAKSTVEATSVVRGKYTFGVPTGSETSNEVAITYEGSASEDKNGQHHGMRAYGVQGTENGYNDYLGINQNHGAVVFRLDKPMLAHITTEQKSCALYNVEYSPLSRAADTSINGAFGLIPIDSSFSRRFISLDAGTYALVSLTTDAAKPAKVTSIEFVEDAPFVIKKDEGADTSKDIIDYNDGKVTGKMIIGTYDSDNDNLIGTTSAESYSVFAILVANNKDALTAANIDNIVGGETYDTDGAATVEKSDNSGEYESKVYTMTVGNETTYTVLRDETDTIFSKIVANGRTIKENTSEEGGEKYYATIIQNLEAGTYYAVGAAKVNGATETSKKGAWLVQESPVEFTVNE